jgi:hypothetical protein
LRRTSESISPRAWCGELLERGLHGEIDELAVGRRITRLQEELEPRIGAHVDGGGVDLLGECRSFLIARGAILGDGLLDLRVDRLDQDGGEGFGLRLREQQRVGVVAHVHELAQRLGAALGDDRLEERGLRLRDRERDLGGADVHELAVRFGRDRRDQVGELLDRCAVGRDDVAAAGLGLLDVAGHEDLDARRHRGAHRRLGKG